jgi:lysophospholipase L1-like esterase
LSVRRRWWLRPVVVARTAALWVTGRGWLASAAPPVGPIARLANDYGDTRCYSAENARLPEPQPNEKRVVFIGDSITEAWGRGGFAASAPFFPGRPYVNRGIGGQITAQMLLRFRADAVALKPKAVVVLGGINDIGGHMGPVPDETIRQNLTAMADIARANGIAVVLASLLPVCDDHQPQTAFYSPARIAALNTWLEGYAAAHRFVYVDYFSAVSDARSRLRAELTDDGLHPNAAGYAVMAPVAETAVFRALTIQ